MHRSDAFTQEADEQEDEEQAQEAPVVPRGGPRPSIDEIKPVRARSLSPSLFLSLSLFHRWRRLRLGLTASAQGAGWTYVRMFDTYNATDLLDYCRKHGLKTTGKKKDLIHRILHFLDVRASSLNFLAQRYVRFLSRI
jgi:hypothetical protein